MVKINEEFLTEQAARKFRNETFRAYPSSKYGTRMVVRRTHCKSFWEVSGSRFK